MKCVVGCSAQVVGIANLKGKAGTSTEGTEGQYPLCAHHYNEIVSGKWNKVELKGWEKI